jgi:hypothetical protein
MPKKKVGEAAVPEYTSTWSPLFDKPLRTPVRVATCGVTEFESKLTFTTLPGATSWVKVRLAVPSFASSTPASVHRLSVSPSTVPLATGSKNTSDTLSGASVFIPMMARLNPPSAVSAWRSWELFDEGGCSVPQAVRSTRAAWTISALRMGAASMRHAATAPVGPGDDCVYTPAGLR